MNAPTTEEAVQQVAATGVALFGEVAKMYEEGYLGRVNQIAKPTRVKEKFYLDEYIVPRWGKLRLNQIQPKAVEDWLHTTFDSWWTMHGVRAIMSRVFYYAEGHGLWEDGKRSPPMMFFPLVADTFVTAPPTAVPRCFVRHRCLSQAVGSHSRPKARED
ncbi:MAG: hypothetical protein HUU41_02375 [Bryobacteraceae bacterium]|nr:hypothetical protein [Bryobacteraceae bacterium]